MTPTEKLGLLKHTFTDLCDGDLFAYLSLSENIIKSRVYGFCDADKELTSTQQMAQVEIAKRLIYKEGAEGEIKHDENGVNRTYGDASGFEDIFKSWGIVPYVGTVKK